MPLSNSQHVSIHEADHAFHASEYLALQSAGFHDAHDLLVAYFRLKDECEGLRARLAAHECLERSTADEL